MTALEGMKPLYLSPQRQPRPSRIDRWNAELQAHGNRKLWLLLILWSLAAVCFANMENLFQFYFWVFPL
jgi:hypothetical protein